MAQLLIRDLKETTIRRLKGLAKRHGRSLQGEVKLIVEEAAESKMTWSEFRSKARQWQERLAATGVQFGDSAELIREDRER
jgi:plasmid stability protein